MSVVKVSWSGGKDSTCALGLHLEQKDTVKACCYIPMFTDNIPLIMPDHYKFILRAADIFREQGAEVNILTGLTYFDWFYKTISRGKNKGKYRGFPMVFAGKCGFMRDGKKKSVESFDVGQFDYEDLGIAYDEVDRFTNIDGVKKRSILIENQYTEAMAKDWCIKHDLLSPHYINNKRDGCALCPHGKRQERIKWFSE